MEARPSPLHSVYVANGFKWKPKGDCPYCGTDDKSYYLLDLGDYGVLTVMRNKHELHFRKPYYWRHGDGVLREEILETNEADFIAWFNRHKIASLHAN